MPSAGETGELPDPVGRINFGERREVTALFYDLIGSTELLAQSDLEDFQEIIAAFQKGSGNAVRAHGGSVEETLGDGGIAFFGYPVPSEDSVVAAVLAGLEVVQVCRQLASDTANEGLHVRVGIATSEVIVQDSAPGHAGAVTGLAPTLASRLQALAPPDTVVVCARTRDLTRGNFAFRHLGSRRVKGLEQKQAVWAVKRQLVGATRFLASGRLSTRMVGRESELKRILECQRRAAAGDGQAVVLAGEAGIGKSRLVYEVLRSSRSDRARVLVLQCSPRAAGAALSPLIELLRSTIAGTDKTGSLTHDRISAQMRAAGITDDDAIAMIAFAAGARVPPEFAIADEDPRYVRERILSAVRKCLEEWLRQGPVVLAVEDVHWIDPTSREVLRDVIEWSRGRPVFVILTTREPAQWNDAGPHVTAITLDSLPERKARALIRNLGPENAMARLPAAALSLIHRRANGIPLYLEELSQWLGEMGDADLATVESRLSSARVHSLENVLSARLGAMGEARTVAQAASVIGREFDERMLAAILPGMSGQRLVDAITRLVQANMVVRRNDGPRTSLAFRHSLIQETLYKALLRKTRTSLHERIYRAAAAGSADLHASILAAHAEQAGLLREAATHYIAAAKECFARSAVMEARQLLERVPALLSPTPKDDDRERLELSALAALGPILTSTEGTKSPEACDLYERAVAIARRRPAEEQAHLFPIYWGWWYTGPDFGVQRTRAETVMKDLRSVADPEVRLQLHHCIWAIDFNTGRHDSCIAAVDAGLALYDDGRGREGLTLYGGHDARVCGLGQKGLSLWLKGFPSQALASVEQAIAWARRLGHLGSLAHALDIAAMLHRYRGDHASLRDTAAMMRDLSQRHDLPLLAAKASIFEGWSIACQGSPARGRELVQQGLSVHEEIGTREDFPVYAEMLAQILMLRSRPQSALNLLGAAIRESERTGHLYWLPELYRKRAIVMSETGESERDIADLLAASMRMALDQRAMALLLRSYDTARSLGLERAVAGEFHAAIATAMAGVEQDGEMASLLQSISRHAAPHQAAAR